jgi:hypothetical protein
MSVSQVCGAPAAGLDVHSSDLTPGACAAPPSQVSQDQMACVSAAAAISTTAAVQVAAEDPFVRDLRVGITIQRGFCGHGFFHHATPQRWNNDPVE